MAIAIKKDAQEIDTPTGLYRLVDICLTCGGMGYVSCPSLLSHKNMEMWCQCDCCNGTGLIDSVRESSW